jgi:transcription elongation factor Elf1
MKRMFDFVCGDFHVTECLIDDSIRTTTCKTCGQAAIRVVSAPRIALEGITGAFPDAADKWVRVRAEKRKQEQKASQE